MKVVCIGEMLIDFVCTDIDAGLITGEQFVKKPGGAPANVAAAVGRLGGDVLFFSAVGDDAFGHFLVKEIMQYGVDVSHIQYTATPTTLAFVSLANDGERDFIFNRGADAELVLSPEQQTLIDKDTVLHLGAATALLDGPLFNTYTAVARQASLQGNIISFDPNYRADLWPGQAHEFVARCQPFLDVAHMVKVSEEELTLLTGQADYVIGAAALLKHGVQLVFVTLGSQGCFVATPDTHFIVPAYKIDALDSTGAGDAFIGTMLQQIASVGHLPCEPAAVTDMVRYASKVSAIVCTKMGAMNAIPTPQEVEKFVFKPNN